MVVALGGFASITGVVVVGLVEMDGLDLYILLRGSMMMALSLFEFISGTLRSYAR